VTKYAKAERAALADTFLAVGAEAPTLCAGWATRDLLAHLLLRERHPVAASGVLLKPMKGYTERRQQSIARRDYAALVAQLRKPPMWSPVSNPLTDELANTLEMYVHHEDVRRAQPNWRPRAIDPGLESALWNTVRRTSRLTLRKFPAALVIESPDHGRVSAGTGGREISLRGRPGELAMFLTGRQQVAEVALTGPDELVERLRNARLGV
jgi:uncharacterized protein (TIGR03085 family)